MFRTCIIDTSQNAVVNVIEYPTDISGQVPPGMPALMLAKASDTAQIGDGWNGTAIVPQQVIPPHLTPEQEAALLVAAGLQIVSTGAPALNGTYAIGVESKANIDGIYAGIKNGDGLPGGGTTFNYRDVAGNAHTFDATSFSNFAKAVRDYLYSIDQGTPQTLPITIP